MSFPRLMFFNLVLLVLSSPMLAQCPMGTVKVRGRVDNLPADAASVELSVTLQTPKGGNSQTASISNGELHIPAEARTCDQGIERRGLDRSPKSIVQLRAALICSAAFHLAYRSAPDSGGCLAGGPLKPAFGLSGGCSHDRDLVRRTKLRWSSCHAKGGSPDCSRNAGPSRCPHSRRNLRPRFIHLEKTTARGRFPTATRTQVFSTALHNKNLIFCDEQP